MGPPRGAFSTNAFFKWQKSIAPLTLDYRPGLSWSMAQSSFSSSKWQRANNAPEHISFSDLSEDLKKINVALHKDSVDYTKIAKTLKLSFSTVAKTIQRFNRTGSTQNRPRHDRSKKLSACAQCHIQRLCLGNRRMSAASIAAEVKGVWVSLSVLRPYAAHCIKSVCMAVSPEESLF